MAKSEQSRREAETIILWNEEDPLATLWTASAKVKREWESFGFAVQGKGDGWVVQCPKNRITYRTLQKV